ncbi:sulfate transporter 4.1, chloroplastic-like isoform X3 [Dendrobium catenatum]|uniref:sulfate transporter 4.1, chloroplastic-like isoform X3 n=1 Tax=Dendrobium catenatum TaxID=906689 RepID=UPI0009F4BDBB|nr:sulfate transporter 4.1, chloroplastic-like isoform X3 [Dendrobium catenatum]
MEISYATSSNLDIAEGDSVNGVTRQVRVAPLDHPTPSSPGLPPPSPLLAQWRAKLRGMSARDWMELLLPCTRWIRTYQWTEYLQVDIMAGITVGVMLVPQAMSYAKLAGLHPIYGLYSGFIPIFVYGIFGSSRQLAIGPVTLVSLLVSNVLSSIVSPKEELYTELAILLAFMVGALECTMGLLRLGWLLRFISHSVISGFITSSAIIIALSQAKYFLGYNIERSSQIVPLAKSIIAGVGNFSWPPFLMGSIILAIILLMKHLGSSKKNLRFLRASGPLTAVILGTAFVKIFHPPSITVVGEIPQGLPKFHIPREFDHAESLISTAVLITGVAILESVGIAKALAAKNGYELDSNQELFGLGMANICGSFFSAYPATGSFSRSAVNHESGAKTGLSGIITGITMGCALYFLTPLFQDIPQCALAAIVISVGISLVSSSLAFVIHESANPHIAVLGRLPGTTVYRTIEQYPEAYVYIGIVVVRIDAPLYFANISYIKDRLRQYELIVSGSAWNGSSDEKIYFVIIEMARKSLNHY